MKDVKKAQNKKKLTGLAVLLLFAVAAAVLIKAYLHMPASSGEESGKEEGMAYETNIIVDDPDSLQDAVDRLIEKAEEGQMSLHMKTEASSEDGSNFKCFLANSEKNNYDMFMVLYLDDTQQEIYRTGLIPPGGRIEEFTLQNSLEPGSYNATLVYNQVEKDRVTIHAQVNVGLLLVVK